MIWIWAEHKIANHSPDFAPHSRRTDHICTHYHLKLLSDITTARLFVGREQCIHSLLGQSERERLNNDDRYLIQSLTERVGADIGCHHARQELLDSQIATRFKVGYHGLNEGFVRHVDCKWDRDLPRPSAKCF